jgi:hypothetical protein
VVYYPYMSSIVGKRRGERTYYYLVESARVEGQPRIVSQEYLGTAEEVMARLSGAPASEPVRSQHKRFGDLAAVWSVLARLDVVGIIDELAPRYANAAASVGTYLALATANRIVDPCSKLAFADWWVTTAGPRWVKVPQAALDHVGSGTRWTASMRRTCAGSRPGWVGGWSASSAWTPPGWCWT